MISTRSIGAAVIMAMAAWSSLHGAVPTRNGAVGDAPDFSRVRRLIQEQMASTGTPSIAVAVARGHDILWEEGFGFIDRPGGTAATADTLYYCASVTKAFTATALLILQDRGALDLDRPANDYLTTAGLTSPYWDAGQATVRRIAMQTSGLATYDRNYVQGRAQERVSPDEIIRRYGVILWRPGDHFDYSNLSYGILGEIVAHASKQTFGGFLSSEIFRPLGMERSSLGINPRAPTAPRYDSARKVVSPARESTMPGASSVYSSAHELALFGMSQWQTPGRGQGAILSPTALGHLSDPTVDAGGGDRHSLAWWVRDRNGYRTLLAQGGTTDSQAWLLLVPAEQLAVVVLGNAGATPAFRITDEILATLLPLYRETRDANAQYATAHPAPTALPASPAPPPADAIGTWSGTLRTSQSDIPMQLNVTPVGVTATLGTGRAVTLVEPRFRDNRIAGRMPADLGVGETDGVPYELHLELYRYEGRLIGGATTYPLPGRDGPLLSFAVELARGPSEQAVSPLMAHNVNVESVVYLGKSAIRVTGQGQVPVGEAYAVVKDAPFHNGAIDVEVAGRPADGAFATARGFIGVAFRLQNGRFEYIFIRPTNGRADDQVRRNHSTQYSAHPDFNFAVARQQAPEKYESYVDLEAGAWTHLRIVVDGTTARLYVHGASQPCLIVNDLKLGDSSGGVALWIGPGTEGYFTGLSIQPLK